MPKARASRTNSRRYKRREFLWLDQVKADDKLPRSAFVCCSACSMLVSVAGIQTRCRRLPKPPKPGEASHDVAL
jgi:hypothetical protein